jgi:hypothetical protein
MIKLKTNYKKSLKKNRLKNGLKNKSSLKYLNKKLSNITIVKNNNFNNSLKYINSINLLSWNISWGSMMGNEGNKTAKKLVKYCKTKSLKGYTWCLNNVVEFLKETTNSFDFLCFQEASNIKIIYKKLNTKNKSLLLDEYGPFKISIATIYNKNKYKLIKKYNNSSLDEKGRPIQIFLFKIIGYDNYLILINLHAPHSNIKKTILNHTNKFINECLPIIKNNLFGVIACGDWNDNNYNYWNNILINKNKKLVLSSNIKPPRTCCTNNIRKSHSEKYYGDYILINNNTLEYIKNNYLIKSNKINLFNGKKYPTSDHLPIAVEVKFK